MDKQAQVEKARRLLGLHDRQRLLVLPNIWDPLGARMLASLGYPAVATASAAVAFSLGYDDGEHITFGAMLDVINRIARSVPVPVSADIERGYAAEADHLAENIHRVIDAGAVGINIEDSRVEGGPLRSTEAQCARIAAARQAAAGAGVPLVINARIDVFLREDDTPVQDRVDEAIGRGRAYLDAGADCLYPIGCSDLTALRRMVAELDAPINVYASADAPPMRDLEAAGIARLSVGPGLLRSSLTAMRRVAQGLLRYEGYEAFTRDAMTSDEIRRFLERRST